MRTIKLLLLILLLVPVVNGQLVSEKDKLACEQRAKKILEELIQLKSTTPTRIFLERGEKGDCVHQPWMDRMRENKIKLAMFFVVTSWKKGNPVFKVKKPSYFPGYDWDELINKKLTKQLKKNGFDKELRDAISAYLEKKHAGRKKDGIPREFTIGVYDDEALPQFMMMT